MDHILSGLLSLTRVPTFRPEPLPLDLIVRQVLASLSEEDNARINSYVGSSPIVLGQDDLLQQVIMNILNNALKYSPDRIELSLSEIGGQALLSVRDFGEGVPEISLNKLTEPFFRIDKRKDGLGLGLALVKHTIGAMGGSCHFQNAKPGLKVNIYLPLAHLDDMDSE
ncbi:MAG: HAMP domain-containing sensor histidine kinase [Deinococcales bacterium]